MKLSLHTAYAPSHEKGYWTTPTQHSHIQRELHKNERKRKKKKRKERENSSINSLIENDLKYILYLYGLLLTISTLHMTY